MNKLIDHATAVLSALVLITGWQGSEPPYQRKPESAEPSALQKGIDVKKNDNGRYASVNGLKIYYESHGEGAGEPLIFLHGGVGGIEMFSPLLPEFAKSRRCIAVDLQGHARTADIDRPMRYELMGEDIAALLAHLEIKKADLLGYSLGAGVALRAAIAHPEMVNRLVIISTPFKRDGWYPEVLAAMAKLGPEAAKPIKDSPMAKMYPGVNWDSLFTKLGEMLTKDYDWSKEVAAIKAPTMLVFADADSVRTEHIMEFYGLLGGGKKDAGFDGSGRPAAQLAVLPNCTHYNILESPALATILKAFIDAPGPKG